MRSKVPEHKEVKVCNTSTLKIFLALKINFMCFKDFPRTRTLYTVTITFLKTTARKTSTNINTSYHISLEYELDDRGRQELFKNFDIHKKTNIKSRLTPLIQQ